MGTRADFYLGKDQMAEWLGSIAWDGMDVSDEIASAKSAEEYRAAVTAFLAARDDATLPDMGWPWPWNTSDTTDCSYWWFDGRTWEARGNPEVYVPMDEPYHEPEGEEDGDVWLASFARIAFPDMSDRKAVTLGPRSGLTIFSVRP